MKRIIFSTLFSVFCLTMMATVNVTLRLDDSTVRSGNLQAAERNLGIVLTEINNAQKAHRNVETGKLPMDEFAVKSLARMWAVTPFYCDDDEVVEKCWMFKDGTMMVNHIPLIITPEGETFGMGTYQEAVVEFDKNGRITDFRLAVNSQISETMEHCGDPAQREMQMVIMQSVERLRTAYCQRDAATIEQMFSEDALIITGKVVEKTNSEIHVKEEKVEYTKQTRDQYIANLKKAFARNKWIDVKFSSIDEMIGDGDCPGITRSKKDPTKFGVRLRQEWRSQNYSDDGYLFLLWEFPTDGRDPIIHVRTWQPTFVNGKMQEPDPDISTMGSFNL